MIDLDDAAALAATDPSDMLGTVERTAEQWADAIRNARAITHLPTRHGITSVVFAGMGGSAIAGDAAAAIAEPHASIPISIVRGYRLPAHVGPNTLVLCSSYSGETEETISCFEDAHDRRARIVVLAAGGHLAARAAALDVVRIAPAEGIMPRAALASLLVPTLVVLEQLGIVPDLASDLADAEGVLAGRGKTLGREVPSADNEAKRLAAELDGTFPVVWGQAGILEVAAARWRCQLNENAKVPATSAALPELAHNEIEGMPAGQDARGLVGVILLRGPGEHPRVTQRIELIAERLRGKVAAVLQVQAAGETRLARLMSAIILGDLTSVYLALRRGVDPTPIPAITALKERLA